MHQEMAFLTNNPGLSHLETGPFDGPEGLKKLMMVLGAEYESLPYNDLPKLRKKLKRLDTIDAGIRLQVDEASGCWMVMLEEDMRKWFEGYEFKSNASRTFYGRLEMKNAIYRTLKFNDRDAWRMTLLDADGTLLGDHEPFYGDHLQQNGMMDKLLDYHGAPSCCDRPLLIFRAREEGIHLATGLNIVWVDAPTTQYTEAKNE